LLRNSPSPMDLVYLGVTFVLFGLTIALVRLCERV
jgi:hypothetical protein